MKLKTMEHSNAYIPPCYSQNITIITTLFWKNLLGMFENVGHTVLVLILEKGNRTSFVVIE